MQDFGRNVLIDESNAPLPTLAEKINSQTYLEIMLGVRLAIKKLHAIKPMVSFAIPFSSLYKDNIESSGGPDFSIIAPCIRIGIVTEFVMKTFKDRKKKQPNLKPELQYDY